jgi:hypothetical protein
MMLRSWIEALKGRNIKLHHALVLLNAIELAEGDISGDISEQEQVATEPQSSRSSSATERWGRPWLAKSMSQ